MAILKQNSAEGGTLSATVTTGNSGGTSGDPFNSVTISGGGLLTYESTGAAHGSRSLFVNTNSGANTVYTSWTGIGRTSVSWRGYIYRATLPGTSLFFITGLQTGGSASFRARITTTGTVELQDSANSAVYISVGTIATSASNRIEIDIDTATGAWAIRVYTGGNADGTTPDFSSSGSGASFGASIDTLRMGNTASNNSGSTYFDDLAYGTSPIGPYAANVAPTADAGADQTIYVNQAVTLAGGGTDSDGTIRSYSWQQLSGTAVSITNPTNATASFTAPATAAVLTFGLTVTDNFDEPSTEDVITITVLELTGSGKLRVGGSWVAYDHNRRVRSGGTWV